MKSLAKRFCLGQFALFILKMAVPAVAIWFCHRMFEPRIRWIRNLLNAPILEKSSLPSWLTVSHVAAIAIPCATILLGVILWLKSVRQAEEYKLSDSKVLRWFVGISYVAALAFCWVIAAYMTTAVMQTNSEREIYADMAARSGVLLDDVDTDDYFQIEPANVVASASELKEPVFAFRFYDRTIANSRTSPAVARHMVGPLIQLLVAEAEAGAAWPDYRRLDLSNDCVARIELLSGESFSDPDVVGGHSVSLDEAAEQFRIRSISDPAAKEAVVNELAKWWPTVKDKLEWEPLPYYELP